MERNSGFFCTNRHIYSLCATDTPTSTARLVTTHKYGRRYFLMLSVTCMALVVFLFNLYRMHRIIISKRLLFKAYPRFATDKCGRISDFIVSLSIVSHMERVFVLVRFCITDIISSSQFIGTLKVKKALNRNKQNGKIRTTFCGLL